MENDETMMKPKKKPKGEKILRKERKEKKEFCFGNNLEVRKFQV